MQLEFFDVPSPCIGVCQSDEKGLCMGCLRNRGERLNWISLTADDKQKVIKRCQQRKKRKENALNVKNIDIVELRAKNALLNNDDKTSVQPSLLDPPEKTNIENSQDLDFGDFEL
tara:strand:- start:344 stop:688 length:345 start_codon:yes stop_codon:yes gene_type:complete